MVIRLQSPSSRQPWIKLCGIRDVETARALAALQPDAIGLNFYKPSRRFVDVEMAGAIRATVPEEVLCVGVFVNSSVEEVVKITSKTGLQAIQLHGDEPAVFITELREIFPDIPIIRAWRVNESGLEPLSEYLDQCDIIPDAILIDAKVAGEFGGTGQMVPWAVLRDYPAEWPPLILAGGLHADNVAEAIETVKPFGIDTAGGIESSPGVKDPGRAMAFVNAVRSAPRDNPP